jgi:hypothetical protein
MHKATDGPEQYGYGNNQTADPVPFITVFSKHIIDLKKVFFSG